MKKYYLKGIILGVISMFFVFSILATKIYNLESKKRVCKGDLVELYDIKYGIFNVDVWKDKIADILSKKIEELKIDPNNRETAKIKIIEFLNKAVYDFENYYKSENRRKSLFGISLKNFGANFLDIFGKFKENIPTIADQILDFLEEEENREKIKVYILAQLDKYASDTFQKIDYTTYKGVLAKYNTESEKECKSILVSKIDFIDNELSSINLLVLIMILCLFIIIISIKTYTKSFIFLLVLISFQFLFLGLLLPMIDIDARIGTMEFNLLGEKIIFENQVLYYKSKSILEMAKIMLTQEKIKIILVGLLVLIFSVLFPLTKLISTLFLLLRKNLISNKIIKFMVFKSGKWSMADVMVVAIFMSYIGFSGIISSQLSQLESITNQLSIVTTNNSELQNGFFFFVTFVLISISISQLVINRKYLESTDKLV